MNISQMLDLPTEERSRYLAAIPLTTSYTMDCLEQDQIRYFRRVITRHGGVYREVYGYGGVYWVVTFRSYADMQACTRALVDWLNEQLEMSHAAHGHISREEVDAMRYHTATFARREVVPALEYEIVNAIYPSRDVKRHRPSHPVHG